MNRRAVLILSAVLGLAGCRRGAGPPDANYQTALRLYQSLYASQLDDAYGDPKMDEVVALLSKVDSGSQDASPARGMLGAIQRGREELARVHAAREKMAAAAQASAAAPAIEIDPRKILAAGAPADAGPPQDPYGTGASVADLNAGNGGCLSGNEPFKEQGTGVEGTVYRLVPGTNCAGKLPGFVGQAVLVVNGRVYRRMVDQNLAPASPSAGAEAPASPQASARPPPPPSAAPDAGEPAPSRYYPGQPQPAGSTPAPEKPQ